MKIKIKERFINRKCEILKMLEYSKICEGKEFKNQDLEREEELEHRNFFNFLSEEIDRVKRSKIRYLILYRFKITENGLSIVYKGKCDCLHPYEIRR